MSATRINPALPVKMMSKNFILLILGCWSIFTGWRTCQNHDLVEWYTNKFYGSITMWSLICHHKSWRWIYSLPNDKILDWFNFTASANDKVNVWKKNEICSGEGIKYHGKRRKCWCLAFSPFSTMFSKVFFCRVVKSHDCMGKGWGPSPELGTII